MPEIKDLGSMTPDQLKDVLAKAKEALKARQAETDKQREGEFAAQLQPHLDAISQLEAGVEEVSKQWDVKIEETKTQKKTMLEAANAKVGEAYDTYNAKRKDFGLGEVSKGSRKRATGTQHKYALVWEDGNNDVVGVKVDENEPTELNIAEGVKISEINEIFAGVGVADSTGGRARGLVNRIKKERTERMDPDTPNA